MVKTEEERLVEQAKEDPEAFGRLYDRYIDQIHTYIFRQINDDALAQDITAAAFEKALRNLHRYHWQGVSFAAWLYRIARNEMIQRLRRERFLAPLRGWMLSSLNVEKTTEIREQQNHVQQAIKKLPSRDREVIILRFYEELSSAEVAEVLGCSTANVYVRLHRALTRLRQELATDSTTVTNLTERENYVSE
ncbi:MAG: sigma-70 family RNA polymerase sigma factor [Anaerolineae bacterium]|nr:sigma-70 family RNA polymerase sigma factor [Anaerolineae bacterium]